MTRSSIRLSGPRLSDDPTPGPGDAAAWWWPTSAAAPADIALLDDHERERADRIRSAAKTAEFVSCRASVRRILSGLLDTPPDEIRLGTRPCPGCGDPRHGPPTVLRPSTPWWISISHTAGCGMLAVASVPVGVDVERMRDVRIEELADTALTPSEGAFLRLLPDRTARTAAFLRCWTRKEAVLKAVGVGISTDLGALESHPGSPGTAVMNAGVPGTPAAWSVSDLPLPAPWVASVALPADSSTSVRTVSLP
ncbi:4'-phosphopantetheinyl transferase superfamily protein [Streptomyces sp. M2CJ-2]|uniref:4'-phosphopantetheinyl transferase family protein n=1 Tax=Streptomyces sp. M2CJ-2 TaxID=2803948 RepID=UPI0019257887|nr:4'-phosphopantetheinyl transferase superfamily protein [Streptomyces sp. M2CJ-2]MBL3669486.1 4'-phosphopantetheinyl transferase superfamily protein [Streptomyces sp. M2CJ-2]